MMENNQSYVSGGRVAKTGQISQRQDHEIESLLAMQLNGNPFQQGKRVAMIEILTHFTFKNGIIEDWQSMPNQLCGLVNQFE
jgi:predicted nucleotidyltransferase